MIFNQWYPVLETREVPRNKTVGVTRLGEKLVFCRDSAGKVFCLSDLCAHRGAALSKGRPLHNCVECPFHGFLYDSTGKCCLIPANGIVSPVPDIFKVKSYGVIEKHGFIWIWWGEDRGELPSIPFFEELDDRFYYRTFVDKWSVHYSRAVENQLDAVHLPFVHRNTIGRGGKTVVDGPVTELVDDEIRVWVYNRVDDNTPARKESEIPRPQRAPMLKFKFPCLWQLNLGDYVRPFLAFVPVDEENTLIYMRYYHRISTIPLIKQFIAFAGLLSSIVILRQDKRVVITQRPVKTEINMGEKLIAGDRPIVLYRKRRNELIAG